MANITNFATLKAAIADWNPHTDIPGKAAQFVQLAEARMNHELRVQQQMAATEATVLAGSSTIRLPNDYLELISVRIVTSENYVLERRPLDDLLERNASNLSGIPSMFAISGSYQITIAPVPASDYTYRIDYYSTLAPLVEETDASLLLLAYPNLYLFAALCEAERFLLNAEGVAWWDAQYVGARNALIGMDRRARFFGGRQRIRVA